MIVKRRCKCANCGFIDYYYIYEQQCSKCGSFAIDEVKE